MGLLAQMKQDIVKSGGNKAKFFYVRPDEKKRIRFLIDADDGMPVTFHDSYSAGINVPCQTIFGRDCPYCDDEDLRHRNMYLWSVWDYDAKEVKLFMFAVNNCSPLPQLMAFYEEYGTLTDRDYVIGKSWKGTNTNYSVIPQDKNKFRNTKAKPYAKRAILKMLDKAYPTPESEDDGDEYEDAKPTRRKPAKPAKKPTAPQVEDWGDEDADEVLDYDSMSPKELYTLCKEREIDVVIRKPKKYYINLLEEWDAAQDDWADEDEGDDWDEEGGEWEDE